MKKINRRDFIGKGAMGLSAALAFSQLSKEFFNAALANDMPIGFQTFPIRDVLAKDFPGTLKTMAGMGYKLVELCSPSGYKDIGFGFLLNMKSADIKSTITDAGLTCPSCHFGSAEFAPDKIDERIEWAHQMGLTQMICSTFWLPKTATIKDYTDHAVLLNKAAEKIQKAGMVAGFHNHSFEFVQLEGQLIYDALMNAFDPALIKMQFQTEVINLGFKASDYFKKYPGRFISSHLSDWTADKKEIAIGKGVIDWKEYFAAAKTGGVQNYFVEMAMDKFKDSAAYIHSL